MRNELREIKEAFTEALKQVALPALVVVLLVGGLLVSTMIFPHKGADQRSLGDIKAQLTQLQSSVDELKKPDPKFVPGPLIQDIQKLCRGEATACADLNFREVKDNGTNTVIYEINNGTCGEFSLPANMVAVWISTSPEWEKLEVGPVTKSLCSTRFYSMGGYLCSRPNAYC